MSNEKKQANENLRRTILARNFGALQQSMEQHPDNPELRAIVASYAQAGELPGYRTPIGTRRIARGKVMGAKTQKGKVRDDGQWLLELLS